MAMNGVQVQRLGRTGTGSIIPQVRAHATRFIPMKGTRFIVMGRDSNSIASAREHPTSQAPLMARRKKVTRTLQRDRRCIKGVEFSPVIVYQRVSDA